MYIDKDKYEKRLDQKGLTVNHLIKKTGVSRATYYKYIKGESEPDFDFIQNLCNELVCPVNYLTKT
jgi:transcriptional regulator with XRE-family HTH domain